MSMSMTTFIEWHVAYYDHYCFRCVPSVLYLCRDLMAVCLLAMCILLGHHGIRTRAEFGMVQVLFRETGLLPRVTWLVECITTDTLPTVLCITTGSGKQQCHDLAPSYISAVLCRYEYAQDGHWNGHNSQLFSCRFCDGLHRHNYANVHSTR